MASPSATRSARLIDNPELLRERLRETPEGPGVYLMRDLQARVVYVGKAANLRNRLRSYFVGVQPLPRIRQLVERIFDFETVTAASEREALLIENLLIKRYRPRFNVRLKDDKNYLYLKIPLPGQQDAFAPGTAREVPRTPRGEAAARAALFPRPYYSRRKARDGARYFGPYTSAQSLRTTVKSLRTIFPFRTCSDEIFRRGRVCLDYHIKRCAGPCEGRIDAEGYAALLEQVELFMNGRSTALVAEMKEQMAQASERLDYEAAARYRDRLRAIDRIRQRQRAVGGSRDSQDAVGTFVMGGQAMASVLSIREGKVSGMETHALEGVAGLDEAEALGSFVSQYYGDAASLPRTILLSHEVPDQVVIQEFLSEQRGGPVELRTPQRGAPRDLVEQARQTAEAALRQARVVADFDADRTDALLADLQQRLDLPDLPRRIECYDISNTMGTNSVGSMVVFEDGRPKPAHYRHFAIRTVTGSNDFASIQETLRRRFARLLRAGVAGGGEDIPVADPAGSNGTAPEDALDPAGTADATPRAARRALRADSDDSFGVVPDLVIVDGGRGQLSAAREVLEAAGLGHIATVGLAKRNEELFLPGQAQPVLLPEGSPTLFLVQRVRDEAHRFAITKHRSRRGREALRSRLDVVSGLGPVRRRALLRRFGSIDGIRDASLEELTSVPGVPRSVALRIKELL